jgi:integrase
LPQRRFTPADLELIKAIDGRRWDMQRRIWLLPHSAQVVDALRRAFGLRLAGPSAHPANKPAQRPGPVGHAASAPRPSTSRHDGVYDASMEAVLDAMHRTMRTREYSAKTERSYIGWARRFLQHHAGAADHPDRLNASHAAAFLEELQGKFYLIVVLLYSAGLRLEECLRLRVKDIDFELRQILVRNGKGQKDRYVPLARRAAELLRAQIARTAELHGRDRAKGHGWAPLPAALHRKDPQAGHEPGWQFVFPASTLHRDPATGRRGRWHLHPTAVQREVKAAVRRSGIVKRASCHTFRHSFATEALRGGCDIRTLQHVMGHKDIRTTMIYLHLIEQTGYCIQSPLDRPDDPDDNAADPVGGPWTPDTMQWDLAARQWSGKRTMKRDSASREREHGATRGANGSAD